MKYLICLLLMTGCVNNHLHGTDLSIPPKFQAGQVLKITQGFYSASSQFIPYGVEMKICQHGTEYYNEYAYTGQVYLNAGATVTGTICERDLLAK